MRIRFPTPVCSRPSGRVAARFLAFSLFAIAAFSGAALPDPGGRQDAAIGPPPLPPPPGAIIARIWLKGNPHGVAVAPGGREVYVTISNGGRVLVIDAATFLITHTLRVGQGPANLVLNRAATRAYVTNEEGGTISVIDTTRKRVIGTLRARRRPDGLCLSPDERQLYVCNRGSGAVSVFDLATGRPTALVPVGDEPAGSAATLDGRFVWVTDQDRRRGTTLSILDAARLERVASLAVGSRPNALHIAADGDRLYVALQEDNEVAVVDVRGRTVLARYATGRAPHALAVGPDGFSVWTGDLDSNSVTVLHGYSGAWFGQLFLGRRAEPHGIAFGPQGEGLLANRVYVTDFRNRELIVLAAGSILPQQ